MNRPTRPLASERPWAIWYGALLLLLVALVTVSLRFSKAYFGWYPRPALFGLFRMLEPLQLGLLIASFAAGASHFTRGLRYTSLRTILVLPATAAAIWFAVWAIVHGGFGIRLTIPQVWDLLTEPHSLQLVGLVRGQLLGTVLGLWVAALLAALLIQHAGRKSGQGASRRLLLVAATGFATTHLAVRGYVAYHIASNQRAVLMLDEGSPLPLRTETLLPGLGRRRLQFASLADAERTREYLAWAADAPTAGLPRKPNILLVSIESLRFDAIDEFTMPHLFARREEFQLRLGAEHWSGGNATKSGTFAMLTGLAAFHLQALRGAGLAFPLLGLLEGNGYRLRIAKGLSFYYGDLRSFLPSGALVAQVDAPSMPAGDRAMVDSLLLDLGRRPPGPAFDLLTFDATHWPYDDPEHYRTVGPASRPERIYRAIRSPESVRLARFRYNTSIRFVDSEIERVLSRLRATGALDSTIVVVTGDHGEEFLERGQLGHSSGLNDFQARVPLWIRFPGRVELPVEPTGISTGLDLVPTLLDYLGLEGDVLRTQGRSLLRAGPPRSLVMIAEQGWSEPAYHALISPTYISRWRAAGGQFLFSSVERRDGSPVAGLEWWKEVETGRAEAAQGYELLPDTRVPISGFGSRGAPLYR